MLHWRDSAIRGDIRPCPRTLWHEPFHIHTFTYVCFTRTLAVRCSHSRGVPACSHSHMTFSVLCTTSILDKDSKCILLGVNPKQLDVAHHSTW